jgi:hypothetical protein
VAYWLEFPVPALMIRCLTKIIPCFVAQGKLPQAIEFAGLLAAKNRCEGQIPYSERLSPVRSPAGEHYGLMQPPSERNSS